MTSWLKLLADRGAVGFHYIQVCILNEIHTILCITYFVVVVLPSGLYKICFWCLFGCCGCLDFVAFVVWMLEAHKPGPYI